MESVGCKNRLLSNGKDRSRSVMVGVRTDEMNGAASQPISHSNERSLGQKPSRWDSIAKSWIVSRDTQAWGRFGATNSQEHIPYTASAVTRAVYLLNRFHSSWEIFLDKDWETE